MPDGDLDLVIAAARAVPAASYPGGWPNEIEAALLDAVLSIQANYGGPDTGVRRNIARYRAEQGRERLDDLRFLAALDAEGLADTVANKQRIAGRLKATAIIEAAANLTALGVTHAAQLDTTGGEHERAHTAVRGLGKVTWIYFGMNLGRPGVKADIWITRFVEQALGRSASTDEAGELVLAAAGRLGLDPIQLDYAIWDHIRGVTPRRRRTSDGER